MGKAEAAEEPEVVRPGQENANPDYDLEGSMQGDAGRLLAQNLAIIKAQDETQMQIAVRRPRDVAKVWEALRFELAQEKEIAPEEIEKKWYVLPFKNHVDGCQNRKTCDCPRNDVIGASVHAARALVYHWGNCASATRIKTRLEDRVTVEAAFLDYERNVGARREWEATIRRTVFSRKQNRRISFDLAPDEQARAINGAAARAERTAILNSLPKWLVERYVRMAMQMDAEIASRDPKTGKALSIDERIRRMAAEFKRYGVEQARIEKFTEKPLEKTSEEDLLKLRGICQALRDGELNASNCFGEDAGSAEAKETAPVKDAAAPTAGAVDASALFPGDAPAAPAGKSKEADEFGKEMADAEAEEKAKAEAAEKTGKKGGKK